MGAKITTPKNPSGFKQNSPKIPGPKSNPQNPLSHIVTATQKQKFAKIFLPKKILKSKISHPKDSFDHRFHLKPRPSPPPPPPPNAW